MIHKNEPPVTRVNQITYCRSDIYSEYDLSIGLNNWCLPFTVIPDRSKELLLSTLCYYIAYRLTYGVIWYMYK